MTDSTGQPKPNTELAQKYLSMPETERAYIACRMMREAARHGAKNLGADVMLAACWHVFYRVGRQELGLRRMCDFMATKIEHLMSEDQQAVDNPPEKAH